MNDEEIEDREGAEFDDDLKDDRNERDEKKKKKKKKVRLVWSATANHINNIKVHFWLVYLSMNNT